jgi:phage gpG-like protein
MLDVGLSDGASAALAGMPERVRDALSGKANMLAVELQAKIQQKLSGTVLNTKSGALLRSIVTVIDDASANVSVTVSAGGGIKYAVIQEYGGTIPPHEILPGKAKALAFLVGGKQAFAARVNLPAIAMPEHSYMRSSLAEMADEIGEELSDAVAAAMP